MYWSSSAGIMESTDLLADEAGLEERHRATETLTANCDDVAIWKFSSLFIAATE